jgi:hypothetical protein
MQDVGRSEPLGDILDFDRTHGAMALPTAFSCCAVPCAKAGAGRLMVTLVEVSASGNRGLRGLLLAGQRHWVVPD